MISFRSLMISVAFTCCLLTVVMTGVAVATEVNLAEFRWRNRLIVLTAPSSEDGKLVEQTRLLSGKDDQFLDRDLKIIQILEEGQSRLDDAPISRERAAAIRQQLRVGVKTFQILLVGKDGTVKLRSGNPLTAERLFSVIDSMPMRRREMREK